MELQIFIHAIDIVENISNDSWDNTGQVAVTNNSLKKIKYFGKIIIKEIN